MHTLDLSVHPVTSTLKMLASLLERITTANDKIKQALPEPESPMVMTPAQHQIHTSFTRFHARSIPSISINAYLTRILKYCPCANECFLSLLVYFDRMARNVEEITGGEGRQFSIDSYNIHRLIIAGIMVSAKYFSDVFFTNSRYAKVHTSQISPTFIMICGMCYGFGTIAQSETVLSQRGRDSAQLKARSLVHASLLTGNHGSTAQKTGVHGCKDFHPLSDIEPRINGSNL